MKSLFWRWGRGELGKLQLLMVSLVVKRDDDRKGATLRETLENCSVWTVLMFNSGDGPETNETGTTKELIKKQPFTSKRKNFMHLRIVKVMRSTEEIGSGSLSPFIVSSSTVPCYTSYTHEIPGLWPCSAQTQSQPHMSLHFVNKHKGFGVSDSVSENKPNTDPLFAINPRVNYAIKQPTDSPIDPNDIWISWF